MCAGAGGGFGRVVHPNNKMTMTHAAKIFMAASPIEG